MGEILLVFVLVALTMVLILLEILTPSLGLLTIMAVGSLVAAVVTAFSIDPIFGWVIALSCLVIIPVYVVVLVKRLPTSALGRKVFLGRAREALSEGTPKAAGLEALVGVEGVAATALRPVGKVRINGQRIDARAENAMIDVGAPVRVIDATGTEVIVREVASIDVAPHAIATEDQ